MGAGSDTRTGRSRWLELAARDDTLVAARIRGAMLADQLVLHCQPTVDCQTGAIAAAEALVRWNHRSGLIPPGMWIGAVEATRLRSAFNLHVLRLAVEQRDRWLDEGIDLPLSVNVTPACLADERFVRAVRELLSDRERTAGIRLEITERTTTINSDALISNIHELTEHGFQFLLDDFGAGYSSLDRLANLSVATLKIDGSLVREITRRRSHRHIVEAVSGLAHTIGLGVVAEGVEDAPTWRLLQEQGCDRIQGYLVARPMPAEDFPGFVREYRPAPPPRGERRDRGERRVERDRRDRRFTRT